MKKQTTYLLLSFLFAFAACSKEDETKNVEQQFIGTWQQVSVEISVNGGVWQDETDACDQQERVKIIDNNDHGLSLYSNNPTECGALIYDGRWDIFDGGKRMTWNIDGIANPIKKEVVEINATSMITIHDVNTTTPTEIRITYTKL